MADLRRTWGRAGGRVLPSVLTLFVVAVLVPEFAMAQAPRTPDDIIRRVRAASNTALEAGDVEAFMASIDADYVGTAGNGGHIRGRAELRAMLDDLFTQAPGLHYVRTPDEIEVSPDGRRAMETGRWVEVPPGERALTSTGTRGRYTAYWRRFASRWVIHSEVFVTMEGGPASPRTPTPASP